MDSKLVGATAELIGFDNLTKPAVALLATHVDHRLRLVVQVGCNGARDANLFLTERLHD